MVGANKDFKVSIEMKNGELTTEVEGETREVLTGLTYLACRVCALIGRTPKARRQVLDAIIESLSQAGPKEVEKMRKLMQAEDLVEKVMQALKGSTWREERQE